MKDSCQREVRREVRSPTSSQSQGGVNLDGTSARHTRVGSLTLKIIVTSVLKGICYASDYDSDSHSLRWKVWKEKL